MNLPSTTLWINLICSATTRAIHRNRAQRLLTLDQQSPEDRQTLLVSRQRTHAIHIRGGPLGTPTSRIQQNPSALTGTSLMISGRHLPATQTTVQVIAPGCCLSRTIHSIGACQARIGGRPTLHHASLRTRLQLALQILRPLTASRHFHQSAPIDQNSSDKVAGRCRF